MNACAHYGTLERPKSGMLCNSSSLVSRRALLGSATRSHGWLLSRTTRCSATALGWRATHNGDTTYDTNVLMNDWKPGATGMLESAQPRFKATLVQERTSESQELYSMQGSTVQRQRDGIAAAGVVLDYETPTLMYVRPEASCAPSS